MLSQVSLPTAPVGDVGELSEQQLRQPTEFERASSSLKNVETIYLFSVVALAAAILTWLGWWKEAGFNRPLQCRNLLLLLFPFLVLALAYSGGVRESGVILLAAAVLIALLAALGQELIFRGVMWRALAPAGLLKAVLVTSLLSGALTLARTASSGPWPEAVYLTLTATCGGFTYAALRWRTASIWPSISINFLLALAIGIATVRPSLFPYLLLTNTLGFVVYGLFLLRNQRVRADGALIATR
jgi:membrane protease YdiL (CAAX protease family)